MAYMYEFEKYVFTNRNRINKDIIRITVINGRATYAPKNLRYLFSCLGCSI